MRFWPLVLSLLLGCTARSSLLEVSDGDVRDDGDVSDGDDSADWSTWEGGTGALVSLGTSDDWCTRAVKVSPSLVAFSLCTGYSSLDIGLIDVDSEPPVPLPGASGIDTIVGSSSRLSLAALDADTLAVLVASADLEGYLIDVGNGSVVHGPSTLDGDSMAPVWCAVSSSRLLAIYSDVSSSEPEQRVRMVERVGTDLVAQPSSGSWTAGPVWRNQLVPLGPSSWALATRVADNSGLKGGLLTIVDDTGTSVQVVFSSSTNIADLEMVPLDDERLLLSYRVGWFANISTDGAEAIVARISGDTITLGSPLKYAPVTRADTPTVARVGVDQVLAAYVDVSAGGIGKATVVTVDGLELTMSETFVVASEPMSAVLLTTVDAHRVLLFSEDEATREISARILLQP